MKSNFMYFPNFKNTLKYGFIVFATTIVASAMIVGVNYGMSWVFEMLLK